MPRDPSIVRANYPAVIARQRKEKIVDEGDFAKLVKLNYKALT